jgi:hypothetical protein
MNSAHPSLGKAMQFDKVKANGLQLTCSPGKNVTSFGSLLRTVGVFFMPCVHERRVWLRIRPGRALLAMSAAKSARRISRRNSPDTRRRSTRW